MRRALVLAVTLVASHARAHVAPSVDDNNRYLKVTPEGDRIRLAYTVFFGEVPGAQARPGIDSDRDGAIGDPEGKAFATKLAADVAAALDVTIDGTQTPIVWDTVDLGLGSPSVRAGSFSVDFVAYACLGADRARHEVRLRDRFRIARPGETELRVEDAYGIKLVTARIGTANDPSHDYKFVGPGGPLSDDGLELVFEANDKAIRSGVCGAAPGHGLPAVFIVCAAAALGFVLALGVTLVRRRKRRA